MYVYIYIYIYTFIVIVLFVSLHYNLVCHILFDWIIVYCFI